MQLVKNPIECWTDMAGADETQKKINAVITQRLVAGQDVIPDECLSEAEMVTDMGADEESISEILVNFFATTVDCKGENPQVVEDLVEDCRRVARVLVEVIQGVWPPSETPTSKGRL